MKELVIPKSANTPGITFNPETGIMKIEGRSIPENPGDFFDPIIEWLEDYFSKATEVTRFDLNLEYVNSGSSKYLLGIFRILKKNMMKAKTAPSTGIMRRMMKLSLAWANTIRTRLKYPLT